MKVVLPALARPLIEPRLPAGLDVHWFASADEAAEMVADADIGWVDINKPPEWARAVAAGRKLKWLSTIYAGLDRLDKAQLLARGTRVTNGSGVNAHTVAEYAVMGALVAAKRYDQVVRIADTREWPFDAPGKLELFETHVNCTRSKRPKSNEDFWRKKLERNMERDRVQYAALQKEGWEILVIWECETKKPSEISTKLKDFLR